MGKLKFSDLAIKDVTKKAITDLGYDYTTEIQGRFIPFALEGKDVIGLSQTGSGKTAAYVIPAIEKINPEQQEVQCLVLCPTRELALQITQEIRKFTKYQESIKVTAIYGGARIDAQIRDLKSGTKIVVGTPGRILDHIDRKTLKLGSVSMVVLDEADEMLSMGFKEDMEKILEKTHTTRQVLLLSATMPREILEITNKYQKNPIKIKIESTEETIPKIEQVYYELKEKMKLETLMRVLEMHNPKSCVVFCNTKRKVDEVLETLKNQKYSADAIHGDIKQSQRDYIMKSFKQGAFKVLVATDVAARGIDINDLEIVINFDMPEDEEYYVHRIGRTGRTGKTGKAFTMVVGKQIRKIKDIERYAKVKIKEQKIPSIEQINKKRTSKIKEEILQVIKNNQYTNPEIIDEFIAENVNIADVAKALLTMKKGTEPANQMKSMDISNLENAEGMIEVFINAGKLDNIRTKDIVGSIAANTGIKGADIGKINLLEKYSFVEIPKEYIEDVILGMRNKKIKGKNVNIEIANK